jgi:hypothetical protein
MVRRVDGWSVIRATPPRICHRLQWLGDSREAGVHRW